MKKQYKIGMDPARVGSEYTAYFSRKEGEQVPVIVIVKTEEDAKKYVEYRANKDV